MTSLSPPPGDDNAYVSQTDLLKVDDLHHRRIQPFDDPYRRGLHRRKQPFELFVQMDAGGAVDHGLGPLPIPIGVFQTPIRSVEGIPRDDIRRQCSKGMESIDGLPRCAACFESCAEFLQELTYQRLHPSGLLGEEGVQGTSTQPVEVMGDSPKHGSTVAEHLHRPPPFVASLSRTTVEHIVEIRVTDVKLVRVDPDYWSLNNLESCSVLG